MAIRTHLGRRGVVLVVFGIALVAGGVAYATIPDSGGVFTGCRLNSNGSLRLIDPSVSDCKSNETRVTWNQSGRQGQQGLPGVSPKVAQLAAGDAHCAAGGAALTDAGGNVAYVCNGATGADGAPGKDGAPFDGTFTSPNGQFKLTVSDGGVSIVGPDSSVSLPASGGVVIHGGDVVTDADTMETQVSHDLVTVVGHDRTDSVGNDATTSIGRDRTDSVGADESLTVAANRTELVQQAETVTVGANRTTHVGADDLVRVDGGRSDHLGGLLDLRASGGASIVGTSISLNGMGNCRPAARVGDTVSSTQITSGAPSVCIGG